MGLEVEKGFELFFQKELKEIIIHYLFVFSLLFLIS
jgi:hypothetical protein